SIPNCNVHNQAGTVRCGFFCVLQDIGRAVRQQIQGPHGDDPPALPDQLLDDVLDDAQQRLQLVRRPVEVVVGQHPDGDDLDAGLAAPGEQLGNLVDRKSVV